jgi:hypothetical protein
MMQNWDWVRSNPSISQKKERHPRGDGVLSRVGLWTKEKGNYFFYLLAKSARIVTQGASLEKRQEASGHLSFERKLAVPM